MTISIKRTCRHTVAFLVLIGAGSAAAWTLTGRSTVKGPMPGTFASGFQVAKPAANSGAGAAMLTPAPRSVDATKERPTRLEPRAQQTLVLRAPWGHGARELGRTIVNEGASDGPMSFWVGENQEVFVLDQVNRRIQVFVAGQAPRSVPLDKDTYQDIEVRPDGSIVLLDRLGSASIAVLNPSGKVVSEVPLVGPGVDEGGSITAMVARADGIWVEVRSEELVRIADATGRADPQRRRAAGRFLGDGTTVRVARAAEDALITAERPGPTGPSSEPTVLATVRFPMPILEITALASTPAGVIALGALQLREAPPPQFGAAVVAHTLVWIGRDGHEIGRAPLALPTHLQQFRSIRLLADGSVYQLNTGEEGAVIARVTL